MPKKVLIVIPNDFRGPPRERFKKAQWQDARDFAGKVESLGYQAVVLEEDLIEPRATYESVSSAIETHKPVAVVSRSYLWADPPIGHAIQLATPSDVFLGNSAYTAPVGAKLGEAPGEVFMLHDTCVARMTGRHQERLIGPLSGNGEEQLMSDLTEFLSNGRITSNVDFPNFKLPIQRSHTAMARTILAGMRGNVMATTGGHCMGMLPCHINVPYHCGQNGWGMNIPIISPDLFDWNKRFEAKRDHYMMLGFAYVQWLIAKGVKFLFQNDWDGNSLPADEQDYDLGVAAKQMGFYAAMLDIAAERKIKILGIPAQLIMTEGLFCGDLIKGVAMSSEGPEGRKHPLFWMTEGDMDGGISHFVLNAVTKEAPIFCDVRCPITELGQGVWMMCNFGAAGMDGAGGWDKCYSVRQYKGYFGAGGGTFSFLNPKKSYVVGLRTGVDQQGIFGTVAIGETVQSTDYNHVVDGRWPQYKVHLFAQGGNREIYRKMVTNHKHFAASATPLGDACILAETVRLAAGGKPDDPTDKADRVSIIYDGRPTS
ncbi:MAG: hypothetical protein NT155_03505 [Candidatus Staskawiczbacteria bacterium]|nr:hypothetical protein [Candidatus Staskawiczbacteria bacterium]